MPEAEPRFHDEQKRRSTFSRRLLLLSYRRCSVHRSSQIFDSVDASRLRDSSACVRDSLKRYSLDSGDTLTMAARIQKGMYTPVQNRKDWDGSCIKMTCKRDADRSVKRPKITNRLPGETIAINDFASSLFQRVPIDKEEATATPTRATISAPTSARHLTKHY